MVGRRSATNFLKIISRISQKSYGVTGWDFLPAGFKDLSHTNIREPRVFGRIGSARMRGTSAEGDGVCPYDSARFATARQNAPISASWETGSPLSLITVVSAPWATRSQLSAVAPPGGSR